MDEEIKRWFQLARDDLKSAKVNLRSKQYYVCIFLCQQSVEKALKAVLIQRTGNLLKVHDLVLLGKKVGLPELFLEKCDALNATYIDTRYGDVAGELPSQKFDKSTAKKFFLIAQEVVQWSERNI